MIKKKTEEKKKEIVVETLCRDRDCPIHGKLKSRGRIFEGVVKKKFDRRIVIEFERFIYENKYERYSKRKTKIHSRLPDCSSKIVDVGDIVLVQECRPLSKIIHSVFIKKIKSKNEVKWKKIDEVKI